MFKVYKKVNKDLYDFTDLCGKFNLRSSDSNISEELSFTIKGFFLNEGDIVNIYQDTKKIYEGIVVSLDITEFTTDIKAYDFGWYLNKNEETYQFNNSVSECIKKICTDFEIPIGNITNIPVNYKKINRGKLSELIKTLIEYASKNTGKIFIWEMRQGKFYLEERSSNPIVFNTSLFTNTVDITKLMNNPSKKISIENLINAVKVTNQEENNISVLAYNESQGSIKRFGKLQKLETLTKEEKSTASRVARNQLKLLNKIDNTISVTLPGIIDCRANKVLKFDDNILNIKGNYKIIQCSHDISPNSHVMSLELELIQ